VTTAVQIADIQRRARAAIADRLRHSADDAVLAVTRDSEDPLAMVLAVNSGGNAAACTQALRIEAGYACEVLPATREYGVRLRIGPGDAVDSELFRRSLALFRSFTPASYDEDLSASLMPVLRELVPAGRGYLTDLEDFATDYENRLQRLYDRFGPDTEFAQHGRYALARQPEGLIVLQQLEAARHDLKDALDGEIDDRYLADLAKAWGTRW
jgi:hypothetical protein